MKRCHIFDTYVLKSSIMQIGLTWTFFKELFWSLGVLQPNLNSLQEIFTSSLVSFFFVYIYIFGGCMPKSTGTKPQCKWCTTIHVISSKVNGDFFFNIYNMHGKSQTLHIANIFFSRKKKAYIFWMRVDLHYSQRRIWFQII